MVVGLGAEDGEHGGLLPRLRQNAIDADGRLVGKLVGGPRFPFISGVTEKQTYWA